MTTFTSEKYQSLIVSDLGIRFVDGAFSATNKKQVDRLRGLGKLGVAEADKPEVKKPAAKK